MKKSEAFHDELIKKKYVRERRNGDENPDDGDRHFRTRPNSLFQIFRFYI